MFKTTKIQIFFNREGGEKRVTRLELGVVVEVGSSHPTEQRTQQLQAFDQRLNSTTWGEALNVFTGHASGSVTFMRPDGSGEYLVIQQNNATHYSSDGSELATIQNRQELEIICSGS